MLAETIVIQRAVTRRDNKRFRESLREGMNELRSRKSSIKIIGPNDDEEDDGEQRWRPAMATRPTTLLMARFLPLEVINRHRLLVLRP